MCAFFFYSCFKAAEYDYNPEMTIEQKKEKLKKLPHEIVSAMDTFISKIDKANDDFKQKSREVYSKKEIDKIKVIFDDIREFFKEERKFGTTSDSGNRVRSEDIPDFIERIKKNIGNIKISDWGKIKGDGTFELYEQATKRVTDQADNLYRLVCLYKNLFNEIES